MKMTTDPLSFEDPEACSIVLVYADVATGARALRVFDRATSRFKSEIDFKVSSWGFDALRDPRVAEVAAKAAADADVVIVAGTTGSKLPDAAHAWLQAWPPLRRHQPGALVALFSGFDPAGFSPAPTRDYLRDLARRAGMDFLTPSRGAAGTARAATARERGQPMVSPGVPFLPETAPEERSVVGRNGEN